MFVQIPCLQTRMSNAYWHLMLEWMWIQICINTALQPSLLMINCSPQSRQLMGLGRYHTHACEGQIWLFPQVLKVIWIVVSSLDCRLSSWPMAWTLGLTGLIGQLQPYSLMYLQIEYSEDRFRSLKVCILPPSSRPRRQKLLVLVGIYTLLCLKWLVE